MKRQMAGVILADALSHERSAPLAAYPVLRASTREDLARELSGSYGATLQAASPAGGAQFAAANRTEVGDVVLHYCRYDAQVEIGFSNMSGLRQFVCSGGRGSITAQGRRLDLDVATTGLIPPDSTFTANYSEGYEHLVLQFDEAALRRRAEAITGSPLYGALGLPIMEGQSLRTRVRSSAIAQALGRLLSMEGAAVEIPALELAQALSSAFLLENAPGFAAQVSGRPLDVSPAKTRALEDYIQQNWNQPISVEDIAAACGVSARSVFAQFRKHRGEPPLVYLRNLRLDHARRLLLSPDNARSVIDVALACGFASFGHFARRYRERFGELPSTTKVRGEFDGILDTSRRQ